MTPILVFDLETVPDVDGIRRINGLPVELPDADVAEGFAQSRRAQTGSDFPPHYLHKVVAIACALRRGDDLRVWSVGEPGESEADLIRLGKAADASIKEDRKALAHGATQFRVSFDGLRSAFKESAWARDNILIAVAGAKGDGTSGLQQAADTIVARDGAHYRF